jgi:hypothetical protein
MADAVEEAPGAISPEQFFDLVVPQLLQGAERGDEGGVCEIHLFGEQRTAWTINLKAGTVSQGVPGGVASDVYLEMPRDDFAELIANRLDVEAAVRSGRLRYEGQLPVLARFAALLQQVEGQV